MIPYEQRAYDVVFTANYVPLAPLAQKISMQEPEYRIFYQGILDDLLSDPLQSDGCRSLSVTLKRSLDMCRRESFVGLWQEWR